MAEHGLPDLAERRRISEQAERTLNEAWALMQRLDRLEQEREMLSRERIALFSTTRSSDLDLAHY